MTTYTINRFSTYELPTFNPSWRELCEKCVHKAGPLRNYQNPHTSHTLRCSSGHTSKLNRAACSEMRHTACANGELFRERVI